MKWFNGDKGFGFIAPDDGAPMCASTTQKSAGAVIDPSRRTSEFSSTSNKMQEGPQAVGVTAV